jgi:hypothetical protein
MTDELVIDAQGRPLEVGCKVDGGNGIEGEVVELRDREGGRPIVVVEWPDSPTPEVFETRLFGEVFKCDDVTVIAHV